MTVLTTHNDRPERSNGAKRNGAARVLVTAGALAKHLSWSGHILRSWSIRAFLNGVEMVASIRISAARNISLT